MAAQVWAAVIAFLFILPQLSTSKTNEDLQAVLLATDKLINYYNANYKGLNLDGFFGLRVLEGQLQLLISEHQEGQHGHLSKEVLDHLTRLKKTVELTCSKALEFVRRDDSQYFEDFSVVISSPWRTMKPHKKLVPSLRWEIPQYRAKVNLKLSEEVSDRCMLELMKSGKDCTISDDCVKIMTTRGLMGYGITHQLLWSILGEISAKCRPKMEKALFDRGMGNISNFQLEMCTNNFYEMVAVVHVLMHGKVHESHQDLFLEQQFVCPNLGFYEFLKKDYLDQILSWQFPSGCFGETEDENAEADDSVDFASLLGKYHKGRGKLIPNAEEKLVQKMDINSVDVESRNKSAQNIFKDSARHVGNPGIGRHQDRDQWNKANTISPMSEHSRPQNSSFKSAILQSDSSIIKKLPYKSNVLVKPKLVNMHDQISNRIHNLARASPGDVQHFGQNVIRSRELAKSGFKPVQGQSQSRQGHDSGGVVLRQQARRREKRTQSVAGRGLLKGPQRRLLVEKVMDDGCFSHKTGVAAGALVMYLRYLISPGDIKWTGQHELFLSDTRNLLETEFKEPRIGTGNMDAGFEEEEEEEEEEDDDDEEEVVDRGEVADDGINYNVDDEGIVGDVDDEEEDNEDEYNGGGGGEDYSDQKDDGEEAAGRRVNPIIRFGASSKSDMIVINDDSEKDIGDYTNVDASVVVNQHLRVPGPAIVNVESGPGDQEEEHNYYDDEGETEKGIIKRRKPPTPRPYPPVRTRRKHSGSVVSQDSLYGKVEDELVADHPNYLVIIVVSVAPFFILFFFLFKFVRRRRVHIRYYF